MPKLFGRNTEDEEDAGKAVEAKFTELGDSIKKVADTTVSKDEFKKTQETVDFIANSIKEAKEERRKAAEAAAKKVQEAQTPQTAEEEFNEFAADPKGAMRKATAGAERLAALALSKTTRAEVLSGKDYYHGDFKKEVDTMIDTGTDNLAALTNPSYILNCYNLVYAKYAQEDKLDSMKRSAAAYGFSDGSSSGKGNEEKDAKPKVEFRGQQNYSANKAKFAQSQLGLTDEELVKAAEEGVINGLEVIA